MNLRIDLPSFLKRDRFPLLTLALISFGTCFALYLLQGRIDIPNADEGQLWYGAIQTADGQVPIRDFQAYNPGRYYWTALWLKGLGTGIMSFRFALLLFQAVGVFFGLLAARKMTANRLHLTLFALLLALWSIQRYRVFEFSWTLIAVYAAFWLLESPVPRRVFASGVFVGFSLFMGQNLGLYSFCSFLAVLLFIRSKGRKAPFLERWGNWTLGILAGCAPLLLMMLFVKGFIRSYLEFFQGFWLLKATNVTLPIPWPWTMTYQGLSLAATLSQFLSGILFLMVPLLYAYFLYQAAKTKGLPAGPRGLLLASACVGVFTMHYAFSRADWEHQAASFTPFLFAALAWVSIKKKGSFTAILGLFLLTLLAVGPQSYFYYQASQPKDAFLSLPIGSDRLWVPRRTAYFIGNLERTLKEKMGPNESILIAPLACNLYPLFHLKSPLVELYFTLPASEEKQREQIEALEAGKVDWLLISDFALEGREEHRLSGTHPLLWGYFMERFQPLTPGDLKTGYYLFHRKAPGTVLGRR